MEGRAIARPNWSEDVTNPAVANDALQWRAEQLPGQTRLAGRRSPAPRTVLLQWRAEQLPGQTGRPHGQSRRTVGRALQWRAEQLPGQTRVDSDTGAHDHALIAPGRRISPSCFNGGPSNCPAKREAGNSLSTPASMEGRAIARPNENHRFHRTECGRRFNGGPSNCPAKRPTGPAGRCSRSCRFNGGPSNCPAKLRDGECAPRVAAGLWRAAIARLWRNYPGFNGGPSNCPAKRHAAAEGCPSMEGRAPGQTRRACATPRRDPLQWRAEQLPGQTCGQAR